ncbi:MAG: GNAT family N-acetyltransferase [Desulfobulbus sp.]|nr:GNAT family N-acetyltransferase [Desulfobulbus sp.]
MENQPIKNELMQRFELEVEGKVAILEYKQQGPDLLAFTHTFVPQELRGKNLAAILTRFALEDARKQGKLVAPLCSYVGVYMERNKEFAELRAKGPLL